MHAYLRCRPLEPVTLRSGAAIFARLLIAGCLSFGLSPDAAAAQLTGSVAIHDPSRIIKDGTRYYVYSTGKDIASKHSDDLVNWVTGPNVFASPPAWTQTAVPGFVDTFWAPDISYVNGQYRLYYSVSTFGSQVSVIGLATNSTLDPNAPGYQWVDQGAVIQSHTGSPYNTIDPSVFQDDNGKAWLTFGSFWNGVYITQLDPSTGLRSPRASNPTRLAQGPSTQIEASYLDKHDGFYYLFVNWGLCCQGTSSTYNIRVGRSASPTGPFVDKNGIDMVGGGGSLFLGSEGNFIGPGHMGILDDAGSEYFSYHYYDGANNGNAKLNIRTLAWTPAGWPIIADTLQPSDFNTDGLVDENDLAKWATDFGANGESDADRDGDSDGADFLAWQQQLGSGPLAAPATAAAPEPCTLVIAFGGLAGVVLRPKR